MGAAVNVLPPTPVLPFLPGEQTTCRSLALPDLDSSCFLVKIDFGLDF